MKHLFCAVWEFYFRLLLKKGNKDMDPLSKLDWIEGLNSSLGVVTESRC